MRLLQAISAAAVLTAGLASAGCKSSGAAGCDTCGGTTAHAAGHGGLGGGLGQGDGLHAQDRYAACVDPCWPERYSYQARQLTLSPFANHVTNGHIIDQTLFNGDFEAGSDKITPGGLQKLDVLARRRPVDGKLFLQTTRDIPYDGAKAADYVKGREDLDAKRSAAVVAYLNASTSGRAEPAVFQVAVIDPADQTVNSTGPAAAVRGLSGLYRSGTQGLVGVNSGAGGQAQSAVINLAPGGQAATGGATSGVTGSANSPGVGGAGSASGR